VAFARMGCGDGVDETKAGGMRGCDCGSSVHRWWCRISIWRAIGRSEGRRSIKPRAVEPTEDAAVIEAAFLAAKQQQKRRAA
jgi:hypothetical protein